MTSATQRAKPSPHVGLPTPANVNKAPRIQQKPPERYNPKLPLSVITRFIGRGLGAQIAPLIEATPTADATIDYGPYYWQNPDFDVSPELQNMSRGLLELPEVEIYTPSPASGDWGSFDERPPLPEIPWRDFRPDVVGFSRSPKKGTLRINVPQYKVPSPLYVDNEPENDLYKDPEVFEPPFPSLPQTKRFIGDRFVGDKFVDDVPWGDYVPKNVRYKGMPNANEKGVTIEFVNTDAGVQVAVKPMTARANMPRKQDTKANRKWIKLAHKLVSVTYGTYTEIMDFLEALAQNIYVYSDDYLSGEFRGDPRRGYKISAMYLNEGDMIKTFQGLIDGRYDLDLPAFLVDYAVMQTTDFLQGKVSQKVTKQSVDQGWWTSPQGPQGFTNRMNKGMNDVFSQITVL